MANCKHPIIIVDYGINPEDGKHQTQCFFVPETIVRNADPYEWARQQAKQNKAIKTYILGCGHCVECKKNYAQEKSIRCYCEYYYCNPGEAYFLTLTYKDEDLPQGINMIPTMREQLNNFIRTLKFDFKDLKYFSAAELGDTFFRPHFHINLFHTPIKDIYTNRFGKIKSKTIDRLWTKGNYDLIPFQPGTAQYTAGYTAGAIKKTLFISQSRNLGEKYILEHSEQIITSGQIPIKGKQVALTRWAWKILEKNGIFTQKFLDHKNQIMQYKEAKRLHDKGMTKDEEIKDNQITHKLAKIKQRKGVDMQ